MARISLLPLAVLCLWHGEIAAQGRFIGEPVETTVAVPENYQGYALRISGVEYALDSGKNKVTSRNGKRQRLELVDRGNRLVGESFTVVEPGELGELVRPHPIKIEGQLGTTFGAERAYKKIGIRESMGIATLGVVWNHAWFGLGLRGGHIHGSDRKYNARSVQSSYRRDFVEVTTRLNVSPITAGPLFFQRLQLRGILGLQLARHRGKISEDDVEIKERTQNLIYLAGTEVATPVLANIWLSAQALYTYQHLEFDQFYFDEKISQGQFTVGASYAF